MKYSKELNRQLLITLVVLLGILGVIGDGSPPDIEQQKIATR